MTKLLYLLGGTALALAVYTILNAEELAPASGSDRAAAKVGGWGTKQRVAGAGGDLFGKVKQLAGDATGDEELSSEGTLDQAAGKVRNAAGKVGEALGDTIHELGK